MKKAKIGVLLIITVLLCGITVSPLRAEDGLQTLHVQPCASPLDDPLKELLHLTPCWKSRLRLNSAWYTE